jgi:CRISPR type III-A-associated RAMP protein Csm5
LTRGYEVRLTSFDVTIEVQTPLHIGNGQEFHPDVDFVVEQGGAGARQARLVDVDAALLAMSRQELSLIRDGRVAAALTPQNRLRYTRAVVPVRGTGNVTATRALQRLSDGRAFIPGTTVKGSIRTALLLALAEPGTLAGLPGEGTDPRRAAQSVEERAFVVNLREGDRIQFANRDLNRAIRVSDFVPEGDPPTAIVNTSAQRLRRAQGQASAIPIWCEAIEPRSRFHGVLSVETDSALWAGMTGDQQAKVRALFETWRAAGRRLLEQEMQAWRGGPRSVLGFLEEALRGGAHLAQLGWGGGWRSKTLGSQIPVDRLPGIARQYRLQRWQGSGFPEGFPVTRKLAQSGSGLLPPGWVSIIAVPRPEMA